MTSISNRLPAVSRCPEEIWLLILRFATTVHWNAFDGRFESSTLVKMDWLGFGTTKAVVSAPASVYATERTKSLADMRNIVQVCSLWRRIALPLLMECIDVSRPRALDNWLNLVLHYSHVDQRHTFVRSLRIYPTSFRDEGSRSWQDGIDRALEVFPFLQEFVCERISLPAHVIPKLTLHCGASLASLYIGESKISFEDVKGLLRACPALSSFQLYGPSWPAGDAESTGTVAINEPLEHRGLRTLFWEATDLQPEFINFVASLRLPQLQQLRVYLLELEHVDFYDIEGRAVFDLLRPIFASHGKQLRWLSIEEHCHDGQSMDISWFLELCPDLEELQFDLGTSRFEDSAALHLRCLRHVLLDTFFMQLQDAPAGSGRLASHITNVRRTFASLCGSNLPRMESIRAEDIDPVTFTALAAQTQNGNYPEDFVTLVKDLKEMCDARGIQFLNSVGEAVGLDFSPPLYYWDSESEDEADG